MASTDHRLAFELDRLRANGRRPPGFGLTAIRAALSAMGDPQDRLPPAIHITGTNGKGSTAAFIRAIAEAAGLTVHAFTSPHLIRVNERIRLAGRLVEDGTLADALARLNADTPGLTYFEGLAAAAFGLFAGTPADLCVIEVGAGGAGDATNVMQHPAVTIVTPISRDHEAMFGVSGVAAIAEVKAGIFRAGVPAIIAAQPPEAERVLLDFAARLASPVRMEGRDWTATWSAADAEAFVFHGASEVVAKPSLAGRHQAQNAGAACAAIEALGAVAGGRSIGRDAMAAGLARATWPSRLQELRPGPLTRRADVGDKHARVWVDGAHNPGGAAALAAEIRRIRAAEPKTRIAIVIAMQAAKDASAILHALVSCCDLLLACALPDSGGQEGGEGASPERLAATAKALGSDADAVADLPTAVHRAAEAGAARIYICGSLYLCGAALAFNEEAVD